MVIPAQPLAADASNAMASATKKTSQQAVKRTGQRSSSRLRVNVPSVSPPSKNLTRSNNLVPFSFNPQPLPKLTDYLTPDAAPTGDL